MIRRGGIVTVVTQGDYGKPRPALIIQADGYSEIGSVTICPLTSSTDNDMHGIRVMIRPDGITGSSCRP